MAEPTDTQDHADELNAQNDGWNAAMGMRFLRATADEVVVEVAVGPQHRQPYGIVHGGVHCGIIEAITSVGAALYARPMGRGIVGLENSTSFLHAVRDGVLRATARPLARGRRTQVWSGEVCDATGRVVATGRVRLIALEPEASLAGTTLAASPRIG